MPPERVPEKRTQGGTLLMIAVTASEDAEIEHRLAARRLGAPFPSEAALRARLFHPKDYRRIYWNAVQGKPKYT